MSRILIYFMFLSGLGLGAAGLVAFSETHTESYFAAKIAGTPYYFSLPVRLDILCGSISLILLILSAWGSRVLRGGRMSRGGTGGPR